jgi:AraC-like DNA-binding protein
VTAPALSRDYIEYPPPAALRHFVECFWTRGTPRPDEPAHRVLPDGCIDIVLGWRSSTSGSSESLAVGTMTRPLIIGASDRAAFAGVRFWPGRAHAFVRVPASEITDLRVDVADLWPGGTSALEGLDVSDRDTLFLALERALTDRLRSRQPPNRTVDAAVGAILRARGNLSIASLAPALGVTRQYLARAFALHVGVPPKTFARIARVRRVLAEARAAAAVDWATLALDAGYYDQAHLAGDVKELTGRTPTEWVGVS